MRAGGSIDMRLCLNRRVCGACLSLAPAFLWRLLFYGACFSSAWDIEGTVELVGELANGDLFILE